MNLFPLLISELVVELAKLDWIALSNGGSQLGQSGNRWNQGGNLGGQGGNQWNQSGSRLGQNGNPWRQDSNTNARLAICRFLDRCPYPGEANNYATWYNGKMNELVRLFADSGEFETHNIANNQNACQNLYHMILNRNVDPDGQFLCSKIISVLGYRWVKNQLIDSVEYHQKFGATALPAFGECRSDCMY